MSFDKPFIRSRPVPLPGTTFTSLVAPFWADGDTRRFGQVFYNSYDDITSEIVERSTSDVRKYGGSEFAHFSASWILVATWVDVPNTPAAGQPSSLVSNVYGCDE